MTGAAGGARVPRQRGTAPAPSDPSRPSRLLAAVGAERGCPVSALLLVAAASVQLAAHVVAGPGPAWVAVLVAAVLVAAVPLAWNLWTGRACECRTFAVLLAACVAAAQVLAATVGAPGGAPLGWSAARIAVVVLAVGVVVVVPWRARALTREGVLRAVADPYASRHVTPAAGRDAPAAGRGGRRRDRRSAPTDVGT